MFVNVFVGGICVCVFEILRLVAFASAGRVLWLEEAICNRRAITPELPSFLSCQQFFPQSRFFPQDVNGFSPKFPPAFSPKTDVFPPKKWFFPKLAQK